MCMWPVLLSTAGSKVPEGQKGLTNYFANRIVYHCVSVCFSKCCERLIISFCAASALAILLMSTCCVLSFTLNMFNSGRVFTSRAVLSLIGRFVKLITCQSKT
jgi:hypothetical protein